MALTNAQRQARHRVKRACRSIEFTDDELRFVQGALRAAITKQRKQVANGELLGLFLPDAESALDKITTQLADRDAEGNAD